MLREIIWGALLASVILLAFTVVVEIVMNGQFFGNNIFGNAAVSLWDYLVTERDQIGIMAQT